MAYVPQNDAVFIAAYAGALAGMGVSDRVPSDTSAGDYTGLAEVAGAFAQAFDTRWGLTATTDLDLQSLQSSVEGVWAARSPQSAAPFLTPSTYFAECDALIAVLHAADAYFVAQGITPDNPASSGAVIFDGGAASLNARTDRPANQSSIDNTKDGIVDLGSDTSGAAAGAQANYACIPGGDRCSVLGDYGLAMGLNAIVAGGVGAVALGDGAAANGHGAVSLGLTTQALGEGAVAVGTSAQAVAQGAFACGSALASGTFSHAEGSSQALGSHSHAEGFGCSAGEDFSHAEGGGCITGPGAFYSHAGGLNSFANGQASFAHGQLAVADGFAGFATSSGAHALRTAQQAHASGPGNPPAGQAQTSVIVLRGKTPGAAISETVTLRYGVGDPPGENFTLEDGKGYTVRLSILAGGVVAAVRVVQSFELLVSLRQDAGVVTIAGSTGGLQTGDAAALTWNLVLSGGAAFTVDFNTGATTAATAIACRLEFTEAIYP